MDVEEASRDMAANADHSFLIRQPSEWMEVARPEYKAHMREKAKASKRERWVGGSGWTEERKRVIIRRYWSVYSAGARLGKPNESQPSYDFCRIRMPLSRTRKEGRKVRSWLRVSVREGEITLFFLSGSFLVLCRRPEAFIGQPRQRESSHTHTGWAVR